MCCKSMACVCSHGFMFLWSSWGPHSIQLLWAWVPKGQAEWCWQNDSRLSANLVALSLPSSRNTHTHHPLMLSVRGDAYGCQTIHKMSSPTIRLCCLQRYKLCTFPIHHVGVWRPSAHLLLWGFLPSSPPLEIFLKPSPESRIPTLTFIG